MILTLYNFRCYHGKHIFNIDDTSVTLIVGESGKGKTSILMALYFVITGNSPSKVITYDCNSCYVELEFSPENDTTLRIHRNKKPNRLTLDILPGIKDKQSFEEQEAQNYINRYFGHFFDITSYIQQQYHKTFLYQSPSEKLEILEKLCFPIHTEFNPEKIKKICNDKFKKTTANLNYIKGQYQVYIHKDYKEHKDEPIFIEEVNTEDIITKQNRVNYINKKIEEFIDFNSSRIIQKNLDELLEKIQSYQNYSKSELEEQLFFKKQLREILKVSGPGKSFVKYSKEECIEMFEEYNTDILQKKEIIELQKKIKDRDNNYSTLEKLKNRLKEIQNTSEGIYNCPSCNTSLSLENPFGLRINTKQSVIQIDSKVKEQNIKQIQIEIENITKIINIQDEYSRKLKSFAGKNLIDEPLENLQKELLGLQKYYDENCLIEEQIKRIEKLKKKIYLPEDFSETGIEKLLTMITEYEQLKKMYKNTKINNSLEEKEEEERIQGIKEEKELLLQEIELLKQQKYSRDIYLLKKKEYDYYLENQKKIQECKDEILKLENELYSISELKKIILKTETDIIQKKTKHISDLVNIYIAEIFTEPIEIILHATKKTNTDNEKFQIHLEVIYKNMKCDASTLSGGEQARLNLAFICAFAHVFNSPLLLLDECTSNLDQNLTECVLKQISTIGIPKIIIIAHQIVEGNFKQIIRL